MRILHTADWHVGKKLGRIDRRQEFEQVLDEIVAIARDQKVDLVLVAGDLLDRALPPLDSISLVLDALFRLSDAGGRVLAIPGNHDSAPLFELLAPLVADRGVHLVPRIRKPGAGGLAQVPSRDGNETAYIAALPFLHEAEFIDFMQPSEEWFKGYADKIRLLCAALCEPIPSDGVGILMGHFFVDGSELGGGERRIQIGPQYAATPQAIPATVQYAALGHVHRPQEVNGAAVRSRYSGSLLQLDFSERTHRKQVVIVDAVPGRPAKVDPIQLVSGRDLIRVEDTIDRLKERAGEFGDSYLDVRVKTGGPVFGLAEEVRAFLPNALIVQASYERAEVENVGLDGSAPVHESYAAFHRQSHGVDAPAELLDTLRELEEELLRASA